MIPVLGVPILTRPELLWKMLDSIDHPVERTIVIDNGGVVEELEAFNRRVTLVRPGHNLGVAASWNHIIRSTPKAKWWMIANFDIEFAPGDLGRLADHMDSEGGVALLGTFSAFGVDRNAIERAGWFDENFIPAYYEDNDFDYRCRLAGVPMAGLPAGLTHRISSTLDSNPDFRRANHSTFAANASYYERKWGGWPYHEVFTTPFNEGGDIRSWRLDLNRLANQSWT